MNLAPLLSLLPAGAAIVAALLAGITLGLFRLPDAAAVGLVRRLRDLAHVVAILNHVLAAEAALFVAILCHNRLLGTPSLPCVGELESTQDHLECDANPGSEFSSAIA
jgi:hypothetical protein